MKYIRTKDGRIIEEGKLEPGLKQTCITLIRKRDNKTLTQIICDDMDDHVEMIVIGEYCKCHKINPKEIRYERIVLLNEVLKQANSIEELCDKYIVKGISNYVVSKRDLFRGEEGGWLKDIGLPQHEVEVYGAIWIELDNGAMRLEPVAKMNEKRELELL